MKLSGLQLLFVSLLFLVMFQVNEAWLIDGGKKGDRGGSVSIKSYL